MVVWVPAVIAGTADLGLRRNVPGVGLGVGASDFGFVDFSTSVDRCHDREPGWHPER